MVLIVKNINTTLKFIRKLLFWITWLCLRYFRCDHCTDRFRHGVLSLGEKPIIILLFSRSNNLLEETCFTSVWSFLCLLFVFLLLDGIIYGKRNTRITHLNESRYCSDFRQQKTVHSIVIYICRIATAWKWPWKVNVAESCTLATGWTEKKIYIKKWIEL